MRRTTGSFIVRILLVGALGLAVGCRDDLFIEAPPELLGHYTGLYTVIEVENGIDTIDYRSQFINFTFRGDSWLLSWDDGPALAPDDDLGSTNIEYFCDPNGNYSLENGVIFTIKNPDATPGVCTEGDNPEGKFALDQSRGDTTYLTQILIVKGNQVIKLLRLVIE